MDILSTIYLAFLSSFTDTKLVNVVVNEGKLTGLHQKLDVGNGSYYSFKGIPYAEPPLGKLRFKDPIPSKSWKGERLALSHGSECCQIDFILKIYKGKEDCLYLNVYTPDLKPEKPLPVMFYIHGGSFKSGSGNALSFGPDFIVQKNVVLVTINYRLGVFGFLNLGNRDVPGNAGLKDQNLALKWVHKNIHNFGGDPNQVTIMGESAGSASVIYHTLSPMSKGLFKKAIAMSGVPFSEWAITYELTKRSFALSKLLGKDAENPEEVLDYLQSVSPKRIVDTFPIITPEEEHWDYQFKMTAFQPAPEGNYGQDRFLVETPIETLKRGNMTPVDIMMGYTSNESMILVPEALISDVLKEYNDLPELLLIPREITHYGTNSNNSKILVDKIHHKYFGDRAIDKSKIERYIHYSSDLVFVYNINRFLRHTPVGCKKYLYKFFCVSKRNRFSLLGLPFGLNGVSHADDLGYIFSSPLLPVMEDSREYRLINQTVTLFTNFVKYGNPTPDDSLSAIWPEYDNDSKGYMAIDDSLVAGHNIDADVTEFWTEIYRDGGIELP